MFFYLDLPSTGMFFASFMNFRLWLVPGWPWLESLGSTVVFVGWMASVELSLPSLSVLLVLGTDFLLWREVPRALSIPISFVFKLFN